MKDAVQISNAKITGTELGSNNRASMFRATLFLDLNGNTHDFGGVDLGTNNRSVEYIQILINAVGVPSWEHLRGKFVRIKHDAKKVYAVGNIVEEKWVNPEEFFKS